MVIQEKYYRRTFIGLALLKGAEAVMQLVLGVLLLFTTTVTHVILFFTSNELIEDPTDFFATHIQSLIQNTPHLQLFGALYMLSFGVLKAFLVWGLLKKRLWVYPAALSFVAVVFLLQAAKLYVSHPLLLAGLSLLDIIFAGLIWHEYRYLQRTAKAQETLL